MSPLGIVLIVILILLLFGGFTGGIGPYQWGHGYGFGNYGVGGVGTILVVLLILALLGYL